MRQGGCVEMRSGVQQPTKDDSLRNLDDTAVQAMFLAGKGPTNTGLEALFIQMELQIPD